MTIYNKEYLVRKIRESNITSIKIDENENITITLNSGRQIMYHDVVEGEIEWVRNDIDDYKWVVDLARL